MSTVFSVCACASASAVLWHVPGTAALSFFRSQNREKAFCHMLVEGGKMGFGGGAGTATIVSSARNAAKTAKKHFATCWSKVAKWVLGGAGTATIVSSAGNACFLRRKLVRCVIHCCACLPGPLQEMMAPMLELLQGENVAAVRGALGRLGCWTDQGQNGGRVSLSSLKHTLGQLNLVTVLTSKDAHEPGSFRCNCSAFVRDAQCVHEGFCRILEKDPKIPLHTLKHFTAKRLPDITQTLQHLRVVAVMQEGVL